MGWGKDGVGDDVNRNGQELHQFVMNNDELALTRIPGVGKNRTAIDCWIKRQNQTLRWYVRFCSSLPLATDSANEGIIIAEVEVGWLH